MTFILLNNRGPKLNLPGILWLYLHSFYLLCLEEHFCPWPLRLGLSLSVRHVSWQGQIDSLAFVQINHPVTFDGRTKVINTQSYYGKNILILLCCCFVLFSAILILVYLSVTVVHFIFLLWSQEHAYLSVHCVGFLQLLSVPLD